MKKLCFLMAALFVALSFHSCSKDDPSSPSALIGTWRGDGIFYTFESGGKGYDGYTSGNYPVSNFTWRASSGQLFLMYDGSGTTGAGSRMYYYVIVDDLLEMYYDDWDFKGYYRKVN